MAEKVRVLQVIDQLGGGGAEMLLHTLAVSLDRSHYQLYICGLRPVTNVSLRESIRAAHVPVVEFNQHNSYDLPALMSLVRYIRRNRIDIIHTHLLAGDVMGRLAGLLTGVPVVSTIHNPRNDLDAEPLRRRLMERWTTRFFCRKLIVVAEPLREEIAGWFGLPLDRVVVIPNGIDTEAFSRSIEGDERAVKTTLTTRDGPIVTNLARLSIEKSQDLLLRAARLVIEQRPDVQFALVGDGPLRSELESHAVALGVADNVTFTGFRTDVAAVLAASDVFVLSSQYEGMPVALLEAMAAGCPAVVTDVGGMGGMIEQGVTGLRVKYGDAQELAVAILELVNDRDKAMRIGACAQQWVREHYGMRVWASRLEALYLAEVKHPERFS